MIFEYDTCGAATIIGQQIQNDEGQTTFRKWNPEKIRVPYGQSTDADNSSTSCLACCYICWCIDKCFSTVLEEVVDCAVDVKKSANEWFDEQKDMIATAAKIIRPLGVFLTCLGFYFLFAPIIATLSWIPLVGWLLSGIVAVAAVIFAIVVGISISLLTIAVAWVFYRPLIGIMLLALCGAGVYFIFFFGESVDPDTLDEDGNPLTPGPSPTPAAALA